MSSQYGERRPINDWDRFGMFGAPQQISTGFASWPHYCTDVAQWRSTKLCTMSSGLLGWHTIYTFSGALAPNGILPGSKFTLRPSLAFSYIVSVTARHSNSGHQPNFAVFSRGRHLISAGRPSRWASADVLVNKILFRQCPLLQCPLVQFQPSHWIELAAT